MIIAYQLMLIVQLKFCNYTHNVSKSRNTESHLGIPWNDINWGDLRNGVTFSRISRVKIISNLENNKPEKFRKILAKFKKRERRKQPRNPNREPKRERLPWVPGFHKMRWIGVQFIPDLKIWIRIHSLDLKNPFHQWELDLKSALHPWELGCLKRVGFRPWKVIGVIVVAVERVDNGEKP